MKAGGRLICTRSTGWRRQRGELIDPPLALLPAGAMLAVEVAVLRYSLDKCEHVYTSLGHKARRPLPLLPQHAAAAAPAAAALCCPLPACLLIAVVRAAGAGAVCGSCNTGEAPRPQVFNQAAVAKPEEAAGWRESLYRMYKSGSQSMRVRPAPAWHGSCVAWSLRTALAPRQG
jgi:hypothetical protein